MATAIDFQALLAEEKRKMLALRSGEQQPGEPPAPDGSQHSGQAGPAWQAHPDRAVDLARPRPPRRLADFAAAGDLTGVYYIPDFVSSGEARDLLARIDEMPEDSWTDLGRRRLQNHGGTPHPDGMVEEDVPVFVQQIFSSLVESGIFSADEPPNHVLINSYRSGQGIAPHQDGPLYKPLVAILSLDGPALLQFWPPRRDQDGVALAPDLNATSAERTQPSTSILCQPNSLLVFSGDAYETHWHGIEACESDELTPHTGNLAALSGDLQGAGHGTQVPRGERRVSLTVRRVLKCGGEKIFTANAMDEERRKEKWWLASRGEAGLKKGFL